MKIKAMALFAVLALASVGWAGSSSSKKDAASKPAAHNNDDPGYMRVEGERSYRANCGRCHAAPQKFPPAMMATIVRHMRVRATITDEDMKLVLFYMTQ